MVEKLGDGAPVLPAFAEAVRVTSSSGAKSPLSLFSSVDLMEAMTSLMKRQQEMQRRQQERQRPLSYYLTRSGLDFR